MDDEIRLVIEKPFPRARDRLEIEVEARRRVIGKKAAQQRQRLGERTDVTNDDAKLRLFAHCQLACMIAQ